MTVTVERVRDLFDKICVKNCGCDPYSGCCGCMENFFRCVLTELRDHPNMPTGLMPVIDEALAK